MEHAKTTTKPGPTSYSQFACIGAGFSGICLGATLKRWHDISDVRIFERESDLGGTWTINQYPGCACDIPSVLYSYSFQPNLNWSTTCSPQQELWAYLRRVAENYDIVDKISFGTSVQKCEWVEETSRWRIHVRHTTTGSSYVHEAQFLFSGAGYIHEPRKPDFPGIETFRGPIVHSARWKKDLDLRKQRIVVVGNGCSASQIIPAILDEAESIHQVFRSKHWIVPPVEVQYPISPFVFLGKYAPWTQSLQRMILATTLELEFPAYHMTKFGSWVRRQFTQSTEKYMRATAPEKYHDILIPDFDLGCRRRIYDPGYLKALHSDKITLTNEPVIEVSPEGVRTKSGVIHADVIILANGFETGKFSIGIDVIGRNGETIHEHWEKLGGPTGYNCTAVSNFPNFFLLCGPNSGTGHTSLVSAIENQVNFALRIIKPIIKDKTSSVELKPEAEAAYTRQLQQDLRQMVWNTGCQNWYVKKDETAGQPWNAMMYPWWQSYYWYRCVFPKWSDWSFRSCRRLTLSSQDRADALREDPGSGHKDVAKPGVQGWNVLQLIFT